MTEHRRADAREDFYLPYAERLAVADLPEEPDLSPPPATSVCIVPYRRGELCRYHRCDQHDIVVWWP